MPSVTPLKNCIKFSIFILTTLILSNCGGSSHTAILPNLITLEEPVTQAKVEVYDVSTQKKIYTTKTDVQGRWTLPVETHTPLLFVKTTGGFTRGTKLVGSLCAYVEPSHIDLIDITTTLRCNEVNQSMNIEAIITMQTHIPFTQPYLSSYLYSSGASTVITEGNQWSQWKTSDADGDSINNWQELLLGLNPSSRDSDHDTLTDNEEIERYHTEANNSDSDDDYIPDNIEISLGSDPLNADEEGDGVADGLQGDPLFSYQWYLYNPMSQNICTTTEIETIAGNDLGILALYHRTFGSTHGQMIVQVVDGGVDVHEDLNISLKHSINSINDSHDPTPIEGFSRNPVQIFYRGHGTAVSGIIGAKGRNGIGVRGVAPDIQIAGSNWLESEELEKLETVWYSGEGADEIAISNNSWGTKFINEKSYETIMAEASKKLRGGKGRIFVFASGNDRKEHANANLSYLINNPYAITVAALNHADHYAAYSTPGSNILVSAYGGEHYYEAPTIMTTFTEGYAMYADELVGRKGPVTVDEDTQRAYTYGMNGTSAAAPMVSGALALVLDLCPDLGWRDVRWLIAHTANKIDNTDFEWIQNSTGLWHNNNYGFGRINAVGISRICMVPDYKNLPPLEVAVSQKKVLRTITDNNITIEVEVELAEDLVIEWVGLELEIYHAYAGDLDIRLHSPSGTISHIMTPNFLKSNAFQTGFRFSTVSLMGEKSKGKWKIDLTDALEEDEGVLKGVKLTIQGHRK